jgi:predicted lipoprotein
MARATRTSSWRLWAAAAACILAVIAILRPWTIEPITHGAANVFDATAYVDAIWATKVLPEMTTSAVDIVSLADESSRASSAGAATPKSLFVKGTGVVVDVDVTSRVGIAHVRFGPRGAGVLTGVQIGPVLRGTAIRDALPFITFSDFTNQLDYADVASALNARVLRTALAHVDAHALRGQTMSVTGAIAPLGADPRAWQIVPVIMTLEGHAS